MKLNMLQFTLFTFIFILIILNTIFKPTWESWQLFNVLLGIILLKWLIGEEVEE